ncbi:MAG: DUF4336 domain-containing protein [Alcanivoracaceae bacterium]|jgi:hypothetical protein|nr:DUF4336 domain-containing protein [Alcanivoracaceae bacterium]
MAELHPVAPDLWVTSIPHRFIGLHLGTRMTVIRLASGALVLHSPVPVSDALRREIEAIGPVRHIICPNLFHHVYAADAKAAFPDALLHGPEKLQRKRKDLKFDAVLSDVPHPDWQGELLPLTVQGSMLQETLFYHPASKTLISCDLVENFSHCDHTPTRWYLQAGGIFGKVGWHPLLRMVYLNRRKARQSIEQLFEWPFERVILAHGDVITDNAREAVRGGLAWLL